MIQKSEHDVMKTWSGKEAPVVSICCICYNHENYIGHALDGMLMQETNFCFEILINDDCSTDNTASIIREYHNRYPCIIKPIYQSENKWSQNIKPDPYYNFPRVRGKLIAMCEGDDYWTDPLKLQKQVNIFEKHSEVSICFHPAEQLDERNNSTDIICRHYRNSQIISTTEVIMGRGGYMPTVSLMFRNSHMETLIELLKNSPIGDYFIQIYMASLGATYYLNEPMCVYRRNTSGSWTESQLNTNSRRLFSLSMVTAIDALSPLLRESRDQQTLYKMLQYYASSCISNTKGISGKFAASSQLIASVTNYNKLLFSAYIRFVVLANIIKGITR